MLKFSAFLHFKLSGLVKSDPPSELILGGANSFKVMKSFGIAQYPKTDLNIFKSNTSHVLILGFRVSMSSFSNLMGFPKVILLSSKLQNF